MNTYTDYIQANKSFEVPDIAIRRFINGQASSSFNRSRLDVFYIPESDVFLLNQKDFSYIMSRNTFVMIILFQDQAHRSYMLPNVDGYYILEIKSPQNLAVIANFETILRNYGQVSYRSGQEEKVPTQNPKGNYLDWSNNFTKASKYLKVGGENLKFHLVKAANKITTKGTENINPNPLAEKTLEELKAGSGIAYIPRSSINYLFTTNRQIEAMTQSQFERNQNVQPTVNNQVSSWNELKRATLDSANLVWQGMEEAASSLYQALKIKTTKRSPKNNAQYQYPQQNQPVNPSGFDPNKDAFSRSQSIQVPQNPQQNALSRSQSLLISQDYHHLEENDPRYNSPDSLPNDTRENRLEAPTIETTNGLYPYLSGPFVVRQSKVEANGINNVPYAESQVFVKPEDYNQYKKL